MRQVRPAARCCVLPIRLTRTPSCSCSAWVRVARPARRRARSTAPRSAACTRRSTRCSSATNIPDTDVYVFYIDVRTPGKNFDEFYRRAVEEYGVHYIKGMVGKVEPEGRQAQGAGVRSALRTSSCTLMRILSCLPRRSSRTSRQDRWQRC